MIIESGVHPFGATVLENDGKQFLRRGVYEPLPAMDLLKVLAGD